MKKSILLICFLFSVLQGYSQFPCQYGLSPSQGTRGQTLTTTITNNTLFNGNGSAPCNPGEVYLHQNSSGTTIYATSISLYNNSVYVTWDIPANAPAGTYDLNVVFHNTTNYNCDSTAPPMNCLMQNIFGIDVSMISGIVYYDSNMDSVFNSSDILLSSQRVLLMPDSVFTFTNQAGQYSFLAGAGQHTVIILPNTNFYALSDDSLPVNVVNANISNLDFALYPNSTAYNTYTYMWGRARCNTIQNYYLSYSSSTVLPVNLIIKLYHSSNTPFVNSSISPDSVNGDTLYFSVLGVTYSSGYFYLDFQIPSAGSTVDFETTILTYDLSGNLVDTDINPLSQLVSCSFDPNDKRAIPEGEQSQHYTLFSSELYYIIRFQNTGNDTAYDIHILDTLDANLDLSTLSIVSSSHPVNPEIGLNGVVDFRFDHIMLPDSNVNEPASNGFVSYAIKPKAGLAEMTVINNIAYIYFDQNVAVLTNPTMNTMVSQIPVGISTVSYNSDVSLYPNPVSESVRIMSKMRSSHPFHLFVTDMQGRILKSTLVLDYNTSVDLQSLTAGVYLYRLIDSVTGEVYPGKLIKQ